MPRIWLHEGHDGDPGVVALGLDHLGFSTWAESRAEILAKLPAKFSEYLAWRRKHGLPAIEGDSDIEVAGHLTGNEILFPPDLEAATGEEVDLTISLLGASRADLLSDVEAAPEGALDRYPPYRRFAPWADWRTVRAILAHVANGETHYYTRNIGHVSASPATDAGGDKFFALKNRLAFPGAGGAVDPNRLSTLRSPIQKFRWVHFPRNAELAGEFTYRVTPVFMNEQDELSYGEEQTAPIELRRETILGS
jgi:hypothetical protein